MGETFGETFGVGRDMVTETQEEDVREGLWESGRYCIDKIVEGEKRI